MKFHQLAIGHRFRYQDTEYTKSSPLLATEKHGGERRMIPRSASVENLESCTASYNDAISSPALAALDFLYQQALQSLDDLTPRPDATQLMLAKQKLARAREAALQKLPSAGSS